MILDVEANEDSQLVLDSLRELLEREWNSHNKLKVGEDKIRDLFYKIKDLGIFDFLANTSNENRLLLNEFLAQYFPPWIITSTAITMNNTPTTFGVDYFPDIDKAELIVSNKGFAKVDEVEFTEVKSPDPTVRLYRIISGKWHGKVDFSGIVMNTSAQIIGHGIYCLNSSIEYSKNRIVFGKPIGSYEAIKHRLVDDAIGLELARSRYLSGEKDPNIITYSFNKSFRAILDSIQIHGGIGFTADMNLHLHLKRVILLQKILSPLIT